MTKLQHTFGPWKIKSYANPCEYRMIWDADGNEIASAVLKTHARLIVAAPETAAERDRLKEINAELLEALEAMVNMTVATMNQRDFAYSLSTAAFDSARTAIAKAKQRGKQMNEESRLKISVDAKALREVLQALTGPSHLIHELQILVKFPNNPIKQLIDDSQNGKVTK